MARPPSSARALYRGFDCCSVNGALLLAVLLLEKKLTGGVETVALRVHERIARFIPAVEAPVTDTAQGRSRGKGWLVMGAAVAALLASLP